MKIGSGASAPQKMNSYQKAGLKSRLQNKQDKVSHPKEKRIKSGFW